MTNPVVRAKTGRAKDVLGLQQMMSCIELRQMQHLVSEQQPFHCPPSVEKVLRQYERIRIDPNLQAVKSKLEMDLPRINKNERNAN